MNDSWGINEIKTWNVKSRPIKRTWKKESNVLSILRLIILSLSEPMKSFTRIWWITRRISLPRSVRNKQLRETKKRLCVSPKSANSQEALPVLEWTKFQIESWCSQVWINLRLCTEKDLSKDWRIWDR